MPKPAKAQSRKASASLVRRWPHHRHLAGLFRGLAGFPVKPGEAGLERNGHAFMLRKALSGLFWAGAARPDILACHQRATMGREFFCDQRGISQCTDANGQIGARADQVHSIFRQSRIEAYLGLDREKFLHVRHDVPAAEGGWNVDPQHSPRLESRDELSARAASSSNHRMMLARS